jgi:uncharacterized iron-regulated protein
LLFRGFTLSLAVSVGALFAVPQGLANTQDKFPDPPDPLSLPIRSSKKVEVGPSGSLVEMASGRNATAADVARAARGKRYVYLGESHNNAAHHEMQAEIIRALTADGRDVVVGLEMFTRPAQASLNPWTLGWWSEEEFIQKSGWKAQWGFDYSLYRPVFEAVRELKLPMVALNVPRDWVRSVGRGGYDALTKEMRAELPADLYLGNTEHRKLFEAMVGGHPMTGTQGENMYAAQVLWDEAMADSAIKHMTSRGPNAVMVVVAGSGHVMHGQGINWRVERRTGEKGVTVVMGEAEGRVNVSRGVGDFVYLTKAPTVPR